METAIVNSSTEGSDKSAITSPTGVTLDGLMKDFAHWRSNKEAQPNIPDSLWKSVFALSEEIDASKLRVLFGLNTQQYKKKWHQLRAARQVADTSESSASSAKRTLDKEVGAEDALFCEAKPLPLNGKPIKPVAFERPAHTYLVEFCRSDGQIMKIHATHDNLPELMASFFGNATDVADNAKA